MQKEIKTMTINDVEYVKKSDLKEKAGTKDGLEYCIIRTYSAGVFAAYYDRKTKGMEGTIYDARRLYYWDGACSLSQVANDGVKNPENCKFSQVVIEQDLKQIIEVLPCTEASKQCIEEVEIWEK